MPELTMEDIEKILGRSALAQYQQERQMRTYVEQLETRIKELEDKYEAKEPNLKEV